MQFTPPPTIQSEIITLRPLLAADREPLYEVANDKLLWAQHQNKDRYQRPVFDALFNDALTCGGALTVLDRNSDDRIIGSTRLKFLGHQGMEIGWTFLDRDYWGTDYNRAMKELLIDYVFTLEMDVVFYVNEHNIRSQKAVGKLGAECLLNREHPLFDHRPDARTYILLQPGH